MTDLSELAQELFKNSRKMTPEERESLNKIIKKNSIQIPFPEKLEFKKESVVQPISKEVVDFFRATNGQKFYSGRSWFSCDCSGEGLILDDDIDKVEHEGKDIYVHSINLALWEYGQGKGKMDWKERLRWCWNILKKGIPWTDAIILTPDEAEKLAKEILRRIEYVKDQEKKANQKSSSLAEIVKKARGGDAPPPSVVGYA